MTRIAHNKLDLRDQHFGRLVAVEDVGRNEKQSVLWECKCDCGNTVIVIANNLTSGNSKSCGCFANELTVERCLLPNNEGAFNAVYRDYHWRAIKKGVVFEISKDVFHKLITQECFYCGSPPMKYRNRSRKKMECVRNGIDRLDNTKGYTEDNVVSCCKHCNKAKDVMDVGEFLGLVHRVARRHNLI